jgi:hypothetical protein
MRTRIIILLLALFVLGAPTWAQTIDSQNPNHLKYMIDGSVTPSQIPDIVAFRLWMGAQPKDLHTLKYETEDGTPDAEAIKPRSRPTRSPISSWKE